ncbi:MAG: cadmium-translocating P-type ATPase [Ruminococcaceae bacterium]|nr:cadmium-translocating P-type ATPase [Oscillospiraceae bacterium]
MTSKQKKMLIRISAAALSMAAALFLPEGELPQAVSFLAAYVIIGWDVVYQAVRGLFCGRIFDEHFLMSLATIGAICTRQYAEAAAVMLFYQVGELFQGYAVGRSRKSIAALMDIRPAFANVERGGEILAVEPEEVAVGERILVRPGEKIPLDGLVCAGVSVVDTAALTGESVPREVAPGDEIISGCVNRSGLLHIEVTKAFSESTVSKILELVENAESKKARAESFISRFARYYTPCVVLGALLLFLLPPLFFGGAWDMWMNRALIFLVISCPCALVISVPLSFFGGIGCASGRGILVKGGVYLEQLAKAEVIVLDKTGTLTKGSFSVTEIFPVGMKKSELLELAALAESHSNHPVALSILKAWGKKAESVQIKGLQELPGRGVQAEIEGKAVCVGNRRLMEEIGIFCAEPEAYGTVVHVATEGRYAGCLVVSDEVKPEAAAALSALKKQGVKTTVMFTGDVQKVAEKVTKTLPIDRVCAELLPTDKVAGVERLLQETSSRGTLIFVGDGINDAPVLTRADVGIAMGAMGQDAAIEAADIVLMDDSLLKITQAMHIARRTMRIVWQNIVLALGLKVVVLLLGAIGLAGMWAAVFADVGVSVLAISNAMRALRFKEHNERTEAQGSADL